MMQSVDELEQRYELRITASGTVRDKDGNVISEEPIEAVAYLTEDEMHEQIRLMEAAKEMTA